MNSGDSKASTRRSRMKASNIAQQKLRDAVASTGAGAGLPPSHGEQSLQSGDLAGDTTPVQARKRRLHATSEGDLLPAKRARSTRTDIPQPGVEDRKVEHAAKTTRQEPEPKSPTRPHASSIEPKIERPEPVSPATRLRKRQIGSDSDGDDNEHQLKRARLTRKNLALFDKMGKKKSAPPESTDDSTTTKTTSTTTSGFAIQAHKNGMLHPLHSKPPTNLENIRERHARSRATASPPEPEYKRYANSIGKAPNEATMVFEVGAHMLKQYDDEGYNRVFNQPFTGFPKDVGFNNLLSAPQPDFVEGLEMQEYDPFPVDEHVKGAVLYKDNPFSLTLPHLAGEWKGCGKNMEKAKLQSRYDGAALVYARNQALSYLGKTDPPGHAEVTTFTTDGTNVNFYAHYAAPSEDGTLKYHQYQYAAANVKDTYQGHKDGRRGIRNEQDHARKQSYALRGQLKEHWEQRRGLHPIAEGALPVPDENFEETNAGEDEAGYKIVDQPCQPTPDASLPSENDYAPSSGGYKRKALSTSDALPVDEPEAAEAQQYGDSSPDEFVDCEEYASQAVAAENYAASRGINDGSAVPQCLYAEDGEYSHDSTSFDAVELSMSFATSVTSSFSTQGHTRSKRNRASHSPPSNPQPHKKPGSAKSRTRHSAPRRSARSSAQASTSKVATEQSAAVEGYWTWSDEHQLWCHLNEDGSCIWEDGTED